MDEVKYENPTASRLDFKNSYGVVMLPGETLRRKRWIALSSSAKVAYFAMFTEFKRHSTKKAGHKNPDNRVKITQQQIADVTGMSHATVVKAVFELRGYRQVREVKVTAKSANRKWLFEKCIPDSRCFVFVREPGGLERNVTEYALNGYYLNTW